MEVLGLMHVNVVCSDFDASLRFYTELLGGRVHQHLDDAGADLRPCLGIGPERSGTFRAALIYWGEARGGPYIDLLEWTGLEADQQRPPPGAQDLGMVRVSLTVDDVDAYAALFQAKGVPMLAPVEDTEIGPWRLRILVALDPDGTLVELVDFPEGSRRRRSS